MKNRMFKFIFSMVLTFVTMPMLAQDCMEIYFNDDTIRKFYLLSVTEMYTSVYNSQSGITSETPDFQYINTKDNSYIFEIANIDSITFTKFDEEKVKQDFHSAMSTLLPVLEECQTVEAAEQLLEQINDIKGVEKAWSDGHQLYIKINKWETISFHFNHYDASKTNARSVNRIREIIPQLKKLVDTNGKKPRIVIANQQHFDLQRLEQRYSLQNFRDELEQYGFDVHYEEKPELNFFGNEMYDYDVVFLLTHGNYDGYTHSFITGQELGSRLNYSKEIPESVTDECVKEWEKLFENTIYDHSDAISLNYVTEFRPTPHWVGYVQINENFFNHKDEGGLAWDSFRPNSIFFNGSCQSMMGNGNDPNSWHSLADKLIENRDLGVYIGYDQSNYRSDIAGRDFFRSMFQGKSLFAAYDELDESLKVESDKPEYAAIQIWPSGTSDMFLFSTVTNEIDSKKATNEFNDHGSVEVEGLATILNADDPNVLNDISYGFEYKLRNGLTWTKITTKDIQVLSKTIDKGNVLFKGQLANLQYGQTYTCRAYTHDGSYCNRGEEKTFTIGSPLQVSTSSLSLEAGWTRTVTIESGSGSYKVESDNEKVATAYVYDNLISINALSIGDATITVTDTKSGQTETIIVTVTVSLQLSATELTLVAGNNGTIEITLGSGEYGVTNLNSDIAKATLEGTTITIEAMAEGEAKVVVTDMQTGQQVIIDVTVKADSNIKSFSLAITELEMQAGSVRSISILGGSGDFRVTNHNPDIAAGMIFESVAVHNYIEIEAYKPGTALIDVEDKKSGDVIQLTIVVTEGSDNPDNPHNSIITFADAKVKEICVANWDTNGDGELSYEEAAAVNTLLRSPFRNTEITSFDEFQYFTGLSEIWSSSFDNCYSLKSIKIPNSIEEIGTGAFSQCQSLSSIVIPKSVKTIADYAFQSCSSLVSISIPDSVKSIGHHAFSYTGWYNNQPDGLLYLDNWLLGYKGEKPEGTLVIKEGTKTIAREAFRRCGGLTSVITPNSMTDILYGAFKDCESLTSVTIGKSGASIAPSAFDDCSNLSTVTFHCQEIGMWFIDKPIKEIVLGDEVKIIGNNAFERCNNLTSVTIPNSVISIESNAFRFCRNLTTVTFGNSVNSIGESAFSGCSSLTSVTIPNSVLEIGYSAFANCSSLSSVTIPNSLITIGNGAFYGCNNLTTITFHCKEIKDWFAGKESINEVIIGDEVNIIGSGAFSGCIGLNNINIPNSVTTIGSGAFCDCSNLASITIPNTVVTIEGCAFQRCIGLTTVTIPNSVTSIGNLAFQGCNGLTSVTIGNSVKNMEYDAFYDCNSLKTITFHCKEIGNWFQGMESISKIIIGDEVTSIGRYTFSECSGLNDVTIGNSVTTIGHSAFYGCSNLPSVTIPNSVVSIENEAFRGCTGLTSITIPNSVTSIGVLAFGGCSNLQKIISYREEPFILTVGAFDFHSDAILYVPKGCKAKYEATEGWNLFKNIVEMGDDGPGDAIISFVDPKVKAICVANWDTNGDGELSYEEAAAVKKLGLSFNNNKEITSFNELQYFTRLTSIVDHEFYGCKGLTSINIPNSVTRIGGDAFEFCETLTSISFGNSLTSIGFGSFTHCNSLTSIRIPNSVTNIEIGAFLGCIGLTSIVVEEGNTHYDSRDNCNAIIHTASNTLIAGCQTTIIPNTVKSIAGDAFCDCFNLTSITIPNSVTNIGFYAFNNCQSLTSVVIGNSVARIENGAFGYCSNLKVIQSLIDNPFSINTSVFDGIYTTATLYVPAGTKAKYEATEGWNKFQNIVEMGGETPSVTLCPDSNHPHMIDLGLPSGTKWACCNVGADEPYGYGTYYTWGGTAAKSNYDYESYEFFTSWSEWPPFANIGRDISRTEYDVAYIKWGDAWQMPKKDQVQELISNCTQEWTAKEGVNGMLFTGPNGNGIFIPASDTRWGINSPEVGSAGYLWSSELRNTDSSTPWTLNISQEGAQVANNKDRCVGMLVRPVTAATSSGYFQAGDWQERIWNGSLEESALFNFQYADGTMISQLPSKNVVADPDNASNHCIKVAGASFFGMPQFLLKIAGNEADLLQGQKFKLTLRAKADHATQVRLKGMSRYQDVLGSDDMAVADVSTTWKAIELEGTVTEGLNGLGFIGFILDENNENQYYFDDISFQVKVGDAFASKNQDGTELIYTIISEEEKTCAVGNCARQDGIHSAMTNIHSSNILHIPSSVVHNGNTYSVTFVGDGAFAGNTIFDTIVIPEGVTYLGTSSFWISLLKSVTIPSTVKAFGYQVFDNNNNMESVYCNIENPFAISDSMFRKQYDSATGTYPWTNATLYVPKGTKAKYEATEGWKNFTNIVEM